MTTYVAIVDASGRVIGHGTRTGESVLATDEHEIDQTAYDLIRTSPPGTCRYLPATETVEADAAAGFGAKQADKIAAFRTEAGRRISELFGGKTGIDLVYAELNANSRANELTNRLAKGQALTVDEQAELDALQLKWDTVKVIRTAENDASAEVLALPESATQADIDAIQPSWPE